MEDNAHDLINLPNFSDDTYASRNFAIPFELRKLKQWGITKAVWDDKEQKYKKFPFQANGNAAKSNDSTTWSYFWNVRNAEYLAFFLNYDYTILDFDHVIRDGVIEPWVIKIIERLNSYTEVSVSGNGLHVILKGTKPQGMGTQVDLAKNGNTVEIYDHTRFFLLTGNVHNNFTEIKLIPPGYFDEYGKTDTGASAYASARVSDAAPSMIDDVVSDLTEVWAKSNGKRHVLTLAIIGFLERRGWTEQDIETVVNRLTTLTGVGYDHVAQVHHVYGKDGKKYGLPTIDAIIKSLNYKRSEEK